MEKGFLWDDVYASRQIDELAQDTRMLPVLNKINGLFKLRQVQVEPSSSEARRRLHFFVNSLFMMMPSIPSMVDCKEYSCLTPFYSEDVLLTRDDLEQKNSDGVGTLLYLQTLYKKDWHNFLERRGLADEQLIWSSKHLQATRMWASMRAQTLFRTVEGMMFSEAAIKLLGELEDLGEDVVNALTKLKFSYVVAAQAYANMKKSGDHKADDIDFLLARHPNLRVAYIETVRPTRNEQVSFYSVLIKHDIDASVAASRDVFSTGAALSRQKHHNQVKEVYRIKLPGNPILGEGKPENQNHAIIFTRGRYLQAIDMNQAGYFEESLKMRNILEEFDLMGCKILGFREHIFTGSVSSVANYMALQELSFVTLGQRVLTNPLCIRQHYGHPDLFDKLFVMCEGGMSKASRGINLSEDVFAGFNATIRGHRVAFKEYVQVGKGRDVGLQQTYKFEAKLSQGNAEQSISRDMNRICARLDFFRLMSFYYGGIGHYIANTTVMFTLVLVVYTMTGCAIFNQEGVNGRKVKPEGILQIALAGMGILQTLPLCATLAIEKGFFSMATEIVYMIVSGGPLYFIFHIQTKSFYFQQTLLAGGAMYRPTGRGFVTRHSSFDENFRFFASSHIYLGVEIMMALIFYGVYSDTKQYLGLTWSLWLVVISFLLGPFWFNPLSFESAKVLEDYSAWTQWMSELGGRSEQSWSTWWNEENAYIKHLSLSWKLCLVFSKCALWTAVGIGLLGKRFVLSPREQLKMVKIFGILVCYLIGKYALHKFENNFGYAVRRLLHYCVSVACIVPLLLLFVQHIRYFRYTVALYYVASSLAYVLLLMGFNSVVMPLYKVHDMLVGHMIFFVLLMMSILQ
ncbi:CALS5, partial [Symbiodinium microadriaticum]